MSEDGKIKETADVIKQIVKEVPIYEDAIQPAAKQLGTSLETITKTVNIALEPLRGLVWGYEEIKGFFSTKLTEKLKTTPEKDIETPKPNVAGPAIDALRFTGHEPTLRDLYANLLAASMDSKTASLAHPSFVEIIKQMTPDEARLMKLLSIPNRPFPIVHLSKKVKSARGTVFIIRNFSLLGDEARCDHPNLTPVYIDNLARLGLIILPEYDSYTKKGVYEPLETHQHIKSLIAKYEADENIETIINRGVIFVTQLGYQFITACVVDHTQLRSG